jgi:hypothetical protein
MLHPRITALNFIKRVLTRATIAICTTIVVLAFLAAIILVQVWHSDGFDSGLLPPAVARSVLHPTPTPRLLIHAVPGVSDWQAYSCAAIVTGLTPSERAVRVAHCGRASVP